MAAPRLPLVDPGAAAPPGSLHPARAGRRARGWIAGVAMLAVSLLAVACSPPAPGAWTGASSNLLSAGQISQSYGVAREQRLTDGIAPAPGAPLDDFVAALFLSADSRVTFDLGRARRLDTVQVLAVPDAPRVETSLDARVFQPLGLAATGRAGAMFRWGAAGLERTARFVRLGVPEGRSALAVGEVLVLSERPRALPVPVAFQTPPTFELTVEGLLSRLALLRRLWLVVGLGAAGLWWLARRSRGPTRRRLSLAVLVLGLGSWAGFGTFRGDGQALHPWDVTHYYLGPKYLPELGYRELYRCIARYERERGRGSLVDRSRVRDLDDYRLHPGAWTATPAGACRARFSPERWQSFGRDGDSLRRLFDKRHFHKLLRDHGFNGTPFFSASTGWLLRSVPPTPAGLRILAGLDMAMLALGVAALTCSFGWLPGALAALVVGLGHPWEYNWTGGSIGRFPWFAALCGGLALLRTGRVASGSFLLALAGGLRLFPLVFLAGLGWRVLRRGLAGALAPGDRRAAWGVAGALCLTAAVGLIAFGPGIHAGFLEKMRLHATRSPGNDVGLRALLWSLLPSSPVRVLAWGLGVAASAAFLVVVERRGARRWQLVPAAAPLLFCLAPLSGYDYVWLAILASLASSAPAALALLAVVTSSKALPDLFPSVADQHLAFTACLLVAMPVLVAPLLRGTPPRGRAPLPRPARAC